MYRSGANARRAPRPTTNGAPEGGAPGGPPPQQSQQAQPPPDTYAAYYQQQAPNGGAYTGPQSPPPPPGPGAGAYAKYGGGGYDGSGAWAQHYPASPTPPATTSYSPNHAPLTSHTHNSAQPVSSFYNHQWDAQPAATPSYMPQHRSNGGIMGQQAPAPAPAPGPTPLSPAPPSAAQGGFYNPNAHPATQQASFGYAGHPGAQLGGQPGGFVPTLQNAVPLMMAGMQLAAGATGGGAVGGPGVPPGMNAQNIAYLGQQMLHTVAPGAAQMLADRDAVSTFMRLPKYYFQVNHAYVRKKLLLLLKPWGARTWVRQRAVQTDASQPEYLPPRDDVNAPDLYIPTMAFATYVLLAGTVLAARNAFKPQVLAQYLSKGAGVLTLEAVVIKLGLYLINARNAPWLDVIAYRGYKFVGVALTMAATLANKRLYWPMTLYSASAMGLFLMRSHRRIVLPRDAGNNPAELARRNAFLLFLCALQYPVYWVLVLA